MEKVKEVFQDIERLTKGREQLSKKELTELKKKYLNKVSEKKEEIKEAKDIEKDNKILEKRKEIKVILNIKSEWIE